MPFVNQESTNILIPDGSSTWALPVIKCLAFRPDFKIFVLSNVKRTAAKYSNSISYYKFYPPCDDDTMLQIINDEIEKNDIDIVMPIAEVAAQFFIKYSSNISPRTKVIPMASLHHYQIAIDKNKLGVFCDQHNIPYPKSMFFENEKDFLQNGNVLTYPVLIKPLHDKGGNGIVLFESNLELGGYISENTELESFFIQEYIKGYDIDCSVLCLNGKILAHTIQKGFLSGPNPYAPHIGIEFLKNDEVLDITQQLVSALNWSGVAHVDLRYDEQHKRYNILEVNARFWGSIEASRIAQVNFPVLICDLTLGHNIELTSYKPIKYLRFRGLLKYIGQHPSYIFYFSSILQSTEAKAVIKDPLPTLYKFTEWLKRQF